MSSKSAAADATSVSVEMGKIHTPSGGGVGIAAGDDDDAAGLLAERCAGELEQVVEQLVNLRSFKLFTMVYAHLSSYGRMDLWKALPVQDRVTTFQLLHPSEASVLIMDEPVIEHAEMFIASLPPHMRLDTLSTLSHGAVEKIVHVLTNEERKACDMVRHFKAGSVGRLMHHVPPGMTVLSSLSVHMAVELLTRVDSKGADPRRSGGVLLVRDDENKLLGWTDMSTLVKLDKGAAAADVHYYGVEASGGTSLDLTKGAAPTSLSMAPEVGASTTLRTVESVAYPLVHVLRVDDDEEELLRQYSVADYSSLPVVDAAGVLQGVVRSRDAIKALNARVQALTSSDTGIGSYSKSSIWLLVQKRIIWLLILAALNFGVAAVVGEFEETLSKNLVLAGFIPLLAGMGGNIGAQTTGLIISAVSSRDIARTDIWRVLHKEIYVGVILSIILGLVAAVMGYIRAEPESKGLIALTIGASMAAVSMIANILGVFMPFGSLAAGQDPAVSSSPLITTAIDVIGISLYLGLAKVILEV